MKHPKEPLSLLSPEQRKNAIEEIISFFDNERGEEIGYIAAEDILDMFLEKIGGTLFNAGVEQTENYIKARLDEAYVDIEATVKKG